MKLRTLAGAIAALAVVSASAHAAGPASVTVRVEGETQTLVPQTTVRTTTAPVNKSGKAGETCSGTSVAGALELATAGDWSGTWYGGLGYSVERIKGETHSFDPDYFGLWVNEREAQAGACGTELQEGDRVLFFPTNCTYDPDTGACPSTVLPLEIFAPATAAPGTAFDVRVVEHLGDGTSRPAAGAVVSGGDAPATAGANGVARVTVGGRGASALRATKASRAPSETDPVCVTDGADGFCGTTVPGQPPAPAQPAAPCATTGDDGLCGTRDRRAPQGKLLGIAEKQRFDRDDAPRELRGTVAIDHSGLHAVKLRITRRHAGRCWYFSKKADDFRRARCGRSFAFTIGDRADWSYLLPERLGPGRYVVDVVAIDRAFNRDPLARGRNRVVFTVR